MKAPWGKLQFIVPINCNSEIRFACESLASEPEIRFACEIRPLGELRKETLRVSILIKMDKTEGFAP